MRRLALVLLLLVALAPALTAVPCCDGPRAAECCGPNGACPALPNGVCLQAAPKIAAKPSAPHLPALMVIAHSDVFRAAFDTPPAPKRRAQASTLLPPTVGPLRI